MRGILIRFINQLFIFFVLLGFSDVRANECKNLFSYVSQLSAEEFVGIAEASAIKHVTCPGCTTDMVKRTQINFLEKMDTAKIFILENEVKLKVESTPLRVESMNQVITYQKALCYIYTASILLHKNIPFDINYSYEWDIAKKV